MMADSRPLVSPNSSAWSLCVSLPCFFAQGQVAGMGWVIQFIGFNTNEPRMRFFARPGTKHQRRPAANKSTTVSAEPPAHAVVPEMHSALKESLQPHPPHFTNPMESHVLDPRWIGVAKPSRVMNLLLLFAPTTELCSRLFENQCGSTGVTRHLLGALSCRRCAPAPGRAPSTPPLIPIEGVQSFSVEVPLAPKRMGAPDPSRQPMNLVRLQAKHYIFYLLS